MTCNMTQRLVSAYVDRELSEDERTRVRQHLAVCPDCMAVYEMTLKLKAALSSMAPMPCPECLWEGVRDQIVALPFQVDTERASRFRPLRAVWSFSRLVVPAAIAGAIVALPLVNMIFGVSVFGPSGPRQQPIAASAPPRLVITAPASEGAGFSAYRTARMPSSSAGQLGLDMTLHGASCPSSPDDQLDLILQQLQDASFTCTWIGGSTHE